MPEYTINNAVITVPLSQFHDALLAVVPTLTNLAYDEPNQVLTATTSVAITAPQQAAAMALLAAQPASWDSIQAGAFTQADAVPTWAKWTEAHFLDWFQTNVQDAIDLHDTQIDSVTTIAQVRTALHTLLADHQQTATMLQNAVRLIIALRNKTWPNLQEPE